MTTQTLNKTGHGRYGRYKIVRGEQHKLCNGPLHREGAWVPISGYFFFKTGKRAGKPMSQCKKCERSRKGRAGMIEMDQVRFIFDELQRRVGRAEVIRRLGVSRNFWLRFDHCVYKTINRKTVIHALLLLRELRESETAIHKDSIKHGAIARGREVKPAIYRRDFYIRDHDEERDQDRERKRRQRAMK